VSRARRVFGATAIGYVHQAVIILTGLWLTPFLLHRIGQYDLGLWMVAGQILGYLLLMDLGVIAILPREVAYASGQGTDAQARIPDLVAQVHRIVRLQLAALTVICMLVWLLLPAQWADLRWPLAWVLGAFVIFYPLRVPVAALQGLQDLPFLAKTQMAGWAASTIFTVGLVLGGAGISALVIGWIAGLVLPAVAGWWRLRSRHLPPATGEQDGVTHYFQRSLWVSVGQVAQVLTNGSDILLVGHFLGTAAVVPYSCTGKLVTVFANHPQLLMHAAQPALTQLRGAGAKAQLLRASTVLSQAMLIMSGALVVIIIPSNHFFVHWWVGPAQYGGESLTLALTLMMLLRHWNVAAIFTLFCFGYERQVSVTNLCDGLVTVIATPLLMWKFGMIGAPIASMIGAGLVSLPVNLRSLAFEMDLSVGAFVRPFAPLLLRVLAMIAVAVAATIWFAPVTLAPTVVVTAAMTLLYAGVIFPLLKSGPLRDYIDALLTPMVARIWPSFYRTHPAGSDAA
jgi:O-antigen/teichoic acid export membrane protein